MTDPVHDLVVNHRRFAAGYALRLVRGARMSEYTDDAVSEAMVGLVEAAQRFNPERGTNFMTFATFHVLNRVGRFLAANRGAARTKSHALLNETSIRMAKVAGGLRTRLGREPTAEDYAAEMDVPAQRVKDAKTMRSARSTPLSASGDFEEGRHAPPSNDPDPEELLAAAESEALAKAAVDAVLGSIRERDAEVIRSRVLTDEPETFTAIAARLGMSRQRADQLDKRSRPRFERLLKAKAIELGWRP